MPRRWRSRPPHGDEQEDGNAFTYDQLTHWHCFAAAVRAIETYRFPYDFKTIQKHCVARSDEDADNDDE